MERCFEKLFIWIELEENEACLNKYDAVEKKIEDNGKIGYLWRWWQEVFAEQVWMT